MVQGRIRMIVQVYSYDGSMEEYTAIDMNLIGEIVVRIVEHERQITTIHGFQKIVTILGDDDIARVEAMRKAAEDEYRMQEMSSKFSFPVN